MTTDMLERIPKAVREELERCTRRWRRLRTPVALFGAGGLAQAILDANALQGCHIVGVLDRNPEKWGTRLGTLPILDPETLPELGVGAVAVASTRFHIDMMAWLQARACHGLEVVDLCRDYSLRSQLDVEAAKAGLRIRELGTGILEIVAPGPPEKVLRLKASAWMDAFSLVRNLDRIMDAVDPDETRADCVLLDLSRPAYRRFRPSGLRLFIPALVEPESIARSYVELGNVLPGQTVLDLGAYAGDSTYHLSKAVGPKGRVLAVEPDPINLQALQLNLRDHSLTNVQVEAAAITDCDGHVAFQGEGSMGSGLAEMSTRSGHEITVPAFSLPTLLARHRLERVDFIKMDIEGAELRVLKGNAGLLRTLRPRMVIEPHYLGEVLNLEELVDLLRELGCRTETVTQEDGCLLVRAWWG